jgi:hypothetical protein
MEKLQYTSYSPEEIGLMEEDIEMCRQNGVELPDKLRRFVSLRDEYMKP